jgi:hypothetical protein
VAGGDAQEGKPHAESVEAELPTRANADAASEGPLPSTPVQEPAPMLEAHAPHEAIHTWKGFLIHIVAIAVGLLIAIGLEQTVEYLHHRHQLREARRELSVELEGNRRQLARNLDAVQKFKVQLDAAMTQLRAAQTSRDPSFPKLEYSWHSSNGIAWPENGAWQTLRQSGSLALMPHGELKRYTYLYDGIAAVMDAATAFAMQTDMASSLAQRSPDAKLLPGDIQELIAATAQCQGKLAFFTTLLQIEKVGLDSAMTRATESEAARE